MKKKGLQEQVKEIESGKIHFEPLTMEMLEEFCLDIEIEMNRNFLLAGRDSGKSRTTLKEYKRKNEKQD